MKPDCRRVLSQIASYSVEELSTDDASAFTRHLDDCPPCQGQWLLFEKTLTTLSETPEAKIEVERSRQMWVACMEHAKSKTPALANQHSTEEVISQPSRSVSHGLEGDRRSSLSSGSSRWLQSLRSAFRPQFRPQFGYALAGISALVLGASYFLSPSAPLEQSRVATTLPAMPNGQSKLVSFQVPPHATTGMLDYHSAMSFEPFSDHVAPTLVSYTATQP
jgi:anti-sigma factor RsiW